METPFSCITCRVPLQSEDHCRTHYKTEFHTFNLRRIILNLPPITLEVFNAKKEETSNVVIPDTFPRNQCRCNLCLKEFTNLYAFQQHVMSDRHIDNFRIFQTGGFVKDNIVTEEKGDILKCCLFCNRSLGDMENSLKHMARKHGFFVPEKERIMDLEGLIKYLHTKICKKHVCLSCGSEAFRTSYAVQQHMMNKGHCFMNTDKPQEYNRFYEQHKTKQPKVKPHQKIHIAGPLMQFKHEGPPGKTTETGDLKLESGKILITKETARTHKLRKTKVAEAQPVLRNVTQEYRMLQNIGGVKREPSLPEPEDVEYIKKNELKVALQNNMTNSYYINIST